MPFFIINGICVILLWILPYKTDIINYFMKIPLYRQIQINLKEKITSGQYEEGGLLPSENDLCGEFSATRMTVRQALNELVKEGYITRQHGKGSTISASRKSLGLLSLKGWTEVVIASDRHGKTFVLEIPYLTVYAVFHRWQ